MRIICGSSRTSPLRHLLFRTTLLLCMGLLVALTGCGADTSEPDVAPTEAAEPAGDSVAANSDYVSTLYETAYAAVHRIDLPRGASLAPHKGGARVVYSISAYTMQMKSDDGTVSERAFEAGDVHYHSGGVHASSDPKNIGDEAASFVVFERTEGSLPTESSPDGQVLDEITPPEDATHEVLLENEDFTVHHIALEPGASLPPHAGHARIVYSRSDYTLTFIDRDSDTRTEQSFAEGDLHDHGAGMHAVENTGDQRADYLVVAFKQ